MGREYSADLSGLRDELINGLKALRKEVQKESEKVGQAIGDGYEDGYEDSVEVVRKSKEDLLRELQDLQHEFEQNLNKFPTILKKSLKNLDFKDLSRVSRKLILGLSDIQETYGELSQIGINVDIDGWMNLMIQKSNQFSASLEQQSGLVHDVGNATEDTINKVVKGAKEADDVTQSNISAMQQRLAGLKDFTTSELQIVLNDIDLDKIFKGLNIAEDEIDSLKQKFIDLLKITRNAADNIFANEDVTTVFANLIDDVMKLGFEIRDVEKIYEDFRKYMIGTKVLYNDTIKSDYVAHGRSEWKDFYKRNKKYISTSSKNAIPADVLMTELVDQFGGLFSKEDLSKPIQDQFIKIMEVWERARQEFSKKSQDILPLDRTGVEDYFSEIYARGVTNLSKLQAIQERQLATERELAAATERAADAEERHSVTAGETRRQLEGQKNAEDAIGDMTDDVAKSLIDKDLKRQLSVLKDALKNTFSDTHNLLDLSDLVSADQLESKLSQMAQDALKGTQGPLEFAKVNITDGIATLTLFNKELGVTVKETWQLKDSFDNVSESVEMNRVAAEKYAKQQENAVAQTGKKINQFTSRLDTQIRSYTSGTYPISGATSLFNLDATTLEKNADNIEHTIDGLVNHIKNLIQKANTDGLTGSLEVEIDKNLRALDNVIKTEQNLQRISIELKAASIPEVIKQLGIALDELETKAKKSGVYTNELAKNITNLRDSLPKLGEDDVLLPDIDYKGQISKIADQIKTEQKKLTASINTKNLEEQQSKDVDKAVASYEKLLEARIKLNQLESEGADKTSSEYQKANRRVEELNAQNEAAKNVLQTEEQLNSYRQRTSRLDSEYNAAIQEQQRKQFDEQQAAAIKEQEQQIKQYYQTILDTVNKINSLDVEITGLKGKNGTGLYTNLINKLQSEKQALITNVRQILQEVGDEFGNGFVGSQDVALSGARFFTEADTKNLNDFMQSAQVQSALASGDINKFTECVNQLSAAFTNSEKIGIEAATKIQESFAKAQEAASKIFNIDPTAGVIGSNGDINEANKLYQQAKNAYEMLNLARAKIGNKPETDWTAQESLGIEILTQQFLEYANTLDTVAQKEQKYFAGKSKYTNGETIDSNELIQRTSENASKLTSQYDKLSEAAKKYAGQNKLIITKFSQSADGINKLDFSTFNKVTGELRNFTFEMGSATDSIYKSGDVIKNTMSAFDIATKQMQSAGGLLNQVKQAGLEGNVEVETLKKKVSELTAELAKGGNADDTELSRLAKDAKISQAEVEKLYKKHLQLQDAIDSGDAKRLGDIDLNGNVYKQLAHHINAFAQSMQGTDVKIGNFNKKTGELKFTMNAADGTVKEFTVSLDRLGKVAVAQETGVKDLGSKWDQFKASLSSTGKQLMTALVGYNVFFKAISEIRKGIGYVKEIDLAMTELKKVTDETEASYSNFLKTASKTASTIGSTISDFTDATANFARLGYSMEESAKMAETAIVYKNVADGLDTVEESTESIISTMKAFGIASSDTMSIIDRYNEVGNNFAITSAGIGEALQRSASALYEAGNTIDESIGLVTAAMKNWLFIQKCIKRMHLIAGKSLEPYTTI